MSVKADCTPRPVSELAEWKRRQLADEMHQKPRRGHVITIEREDRCSMRLVRKTCSCGWKGEWTK